MSADRVVVFTCAALAMFWAGVEVGTYQERKAQAARAAIEAAKPRPALVRPIGYQLLGCPVNVDRITEYRRVCKARERSEPIGRTK